MKKTCISYWFHQHNFSMICVLGHEICGKKPQVGVLMTVTVWLLREGIVERKSNLRGNTGICSEAQLTLLMLPPAKQAHWAPGYGEEEKMSNSCRASRLHGLQVAPCFCWRKKKIVFSRVAETRKWEHHTFIWLHEKPIWVLWGWS